MKKAIMVLIALMIMLVPCALADYHLTVRKSVPSGYVVRGQTMMYNVNMALDKKTVNGVVYYNTQGNINGWTNSWNSIQWDVKAADYKVVFEDDEVVSINTYAKVNGEKMPIDITMDKVTKELTITTDAICLTA